MNAGDRQDGGGGVAAAFFDVAKRNLVLDYIARPLIRPRYERTGFLLRT